MCIYTEQVELFRDCKRTVSMQTSFSNRFEVVLNILEAAFTLSDE